MQAYKIETTITQEGIIKLPESLHDIFNHKVELVVLDKETAQKKNHSQSLGEYHLGGVLDDVNIRDLAYED